jgi:PAS domain S-box-containing protein
MFKVLLVDDEPAIRLTIAEFLRREGYEMLTAADGEQATELIRTGDIDIAILDINLPRRSGIELLQELQERDAYVPVIMITGEPNLSQIPDIIRAGAYDFISKPVVKDTIIRAVERAAEKKRLIDEKRSLERAIKQHAEELEVRVAERTAELADAHGFLNLVLDSSTEYAIVALDLESRVTLFNRGAELMFGYTSADALGRRPRELFVSTENADIETFQKCLNEAESFGRYQSEIHLRRAGREEFVASVAITPIRAATRQGVGYLCVIRDMTVEREAEERLRQMQARLAHQEKIAALGRVAAQVAHEVKNPLAGLLLYSMHLKSKAASKLAESEAKLIDKIIDTINHLTRTVEQIMDFARPLSLRPCEVDLNGVVSDVLQLLQPQMEANHIERQLSLQEGTLSARLDESVIRSALMNLVLNAVQAMPEGGRLSVTTRDAQAGSGGGNGHDSAGANGAESERPKLLLEIADTGSGMTEEQVKNIFEPFYTTKSQGLGLGMPYAKKVVEQHQGKITVESRPKQGTCVRIELPAGAEGE